MSWVDFFRSLPPQYQAKARQDWMAYQSEIRRPKAPAEATPAESEFAQPSPVADPGASGEQQEFGFMESPQQFLQKLRDGVNQFGRSFNVQTIRPYNNAIQHALRAIKSLSQQPNLDPAVREQGEELLRLFQNIQASDAADTQLVNQLGQVAFQLGQAANAYQPGVASNPVTRAPAPVSQPQPYARAASLTAEVSSAARLLQ